MYMIQSKDYIFAPDFVTYNKKLDYSETEVLWHLVHFPDETTIEMIMKLVFDSRSYGIKVFYYYAYRIALIYYCFVLKPPNARYFLAYNKSTLADDENDLEETEQESINHDSKSTDDDGFVTPKGIINYSFLMHY